MILVTGATGQYGANAIDHLLNKGINSSQITALVRNIEKSHDLQKKGISLRLGDYTDYDSMVNAFSGIDKLLFVSSSEIEDRLSQHELVIKAAKKAEVNYIVYTSFIRPDVNNSAISFLQDTHVQTEQLIIESEIQYTILQNGIYLDMLPMFIGEQVSQTGLISLPAESGAASWTMRDELAEAAAHVLTTEGHGNKIYPLTNSESVSYQDVSNILSIIFDKKIEYQSPAVNDFQSSLRKLQVPEEYVGLLTAFSLAQANGELKVTDTTLESFLGRKPTKVTEYLKQVYSK